MSHSALLAPILSIALSASAAASPQQQSPHVLREFYEVKLAEPRVAEGVWVADFGKAQARAKEENKFIFAYFTRSS